MCGIFGCISDDAAAKTLDGLMKLEYRGYDSAGLAAIIPSKKSQIETERTTGYVSDLVSKANGRFNGATTSIGHTRWATHGGVTDSNAHPHTSNDGTITLVHNGIIENAFDLQSKVENLGYSIKSETDSELIVHLLHNEITTQKDTKSRLKALESTVGMLKGSWAIAVIFSGEESIYVARNGAPLVLGRGHDILCVSSDIQPLYGICSEVSYLNDGDIVKISRESIESRNPEYTAHFETLNGDFERSEKGPFPNYMLKEIHEQPISLSNVLGGRISSDGRKAALGGFSLNPSEIRSLRRINLVGCGTAYFAAKIGANLLHKHTGLTVESFRGSEFPAKFVCGENTLTIGISQSGETKDTLDALHTAKLFGGHISSFCNVIGSTMARLTSNGAYLYAGPEYAVASTKAFSNMIAALVLFSLTLSETDVKEKQRIVQDLRELPSKVSNQLKEDDGSIDKAVAILENAPYSLFVGRGFSSALVQEGALKMMELAYMPCISLPGGELKHGTIALIEEGIPVIAVAPSDDTLNLMESTIRECKTRGAKIILVTDTEEPITRLADVVIQTQQSVHETSPIINVIPLQILAYRLAEKKGFNIDRPRNLAKSVTVT